jgi:hypothetical protein
MFCVLPSFFTSSSPSEPHAKKESPMVSRRRFGWQVALLAGWTLSPTGLFARAHNPHRQSHNADLSPEQNAEVDAKLASIVRKYGSRLSDQQREHLRRILSYNEKMLAAVRVFPLQNGDPPASVLMFSRLSEPPSCRAPRVPRGPADSSKEGQG